MKCYIYFLYLLHGYGWFTWYVHLDLSCGETYMDHVSSGIPLICLTCCYNYCHSKINSFPVIHPPPALFHALFSNASHKRLRNWSHKNGSSYIPAGAKLSSKTWNIDIEAYSIVIMISMVVSNMKSLMEMDPHSHRPKYRDRQQNIYL